MAVNADQVFVALANDLRDASRIQRDGQEDDLRAAVQMLSKQCNTLSLYLKNTIASLNSQTTDLEVTKSNLALIQANNEMLEDALKSSGATPGLGWSRGQSSATSKRTSFINSRLPGILDSTTPQSPATADGRFFRFGPKASKDSRPNTPTQPLPSAPLPRRSTSSDRSGSPDASNEVDELKIKHKEETDVLLKQLDEEKLKTKQALEEKKLLEDEIESLSQALFEEANKMVATERQLRAASDDSLKSVESERDALRATLKLIQDKVASSPTSRRPSSSAPSPLDPKSLRPPSPSDVPNFSVPSFSPVTPKKDAIPGGFSFGEDSSPWS